MPHILDIQSFLARRDAGWPVLDARSPAEYARAHIAGALNLPVLDDEERAAVGTAHAKSGPEAAVHLALRLAGPQLAAKLARAHALIREGHASDARDGKSAGGHGKSARKNVLVHCWRGGMRSRSLAWLLELGGYSVHMLEGGYKAYRNWARACLTQPRPVLVLGGMTGSGKTAMLAELARLGAQVIDLEELAGHRGSAFGGVGLGGQPCNEWVENALAERWRNLSPSRPVWLEDEDRRIGSVSLCGEFFEHIRTSPLVLVDVPLADRVERLARMYTGPGYRDALLACVERLRARLGDEAARRCMDDIRSGRYREAVAALLRYYDTRYARQMDKHGRPLVRRIALAGDNPVLAARLLLETEQAWKPPV
ncbi:MAG: tRNA 2-selenouridine(34) synthase MnmH [Desulfovibrionaceae bacterium]|nr:tRNA 2-selenouridine(34) synthase MnmH [Desulfovibrionaceae bacterium]